MSGIKGIRSTAMKALEAIIKALVRSGTRSLPEWEKQRVLDVAREFPEKSSRELACHITDKMDYFISESSVYRILKTYDLVTSPVYTVISAKDKFEHPTTRIN